MDDDSMGRLYARHVPVPPTPTEAMWRTIAAELPDQRDELQRLPLHGPPRFVHGFGVVFRQLHDL